MFGRSSASFDRLLEKATSQLLLEPDWTSIMMICDSIRQGDTNPKYAVTAIKKKFYHTNPHVALYALQVMESCVKNCGMLVHDEICTKQFMEELREMVKQNTDENIKTKVLELLQTWGMAFRNSPKYRIVTDTLNLMKAEGWNFPPVREAEAMFEADTAPEWAEGDVCSRCRVQFSTFTRQHHCRACGQVFCGKCSSKFCVLPKFGIEKEVRTCDSCFEKYGPQESDLSSTDKEPVRLKKEAKSDQSDLPAEYLASPLSKQPQVPEKQAGKSEAELREEEELQLAIAISQSEAEEKEKQKKKATSEMFSGYSGPTNLTNGSNGSPAVAVDKTSEEGVGMNSELEKYLNRDYWERKERDTGPASVPQMVQETAQGAPVTSDQDRAAIEEMNEFTETLRTQLEIFVNRMKSNSSRGRPIANDTSVQTLFMNIMTMHGKLVRHIQDEEDQRVKYEGLQDKLTQIKDARAALDALREEELERKRREQEEQERQRQVQLAAKLEVMRKKKAEYLEYQRQLALQRMAEQEREVASKAGGYMQPPGPGMYNMYMPQPPPQHLYHHQPHLGQQPAVMAQGGAGGLPGYPGYPPPPPADIQQHQHQHQLQAPAPGHDQQHQQQQQQQIPQPMQPAVTSPNQAHFNMAGMAAALPQQYMMSPPQHHHQPPHVHQQPQQMFASPPAQAQPLQPQPEAPSESLICFD